MLIGTKMHVFATHLAWGWQSIVSTEFKEGFGG